MLTNPYFVSGYVMQEMRPVSYTHLDVYKRQIAYTVPENIQTMNKY